MHELLGEPITSAILMATGLKDFDLSIGVNRFRHLLLRCPTSNVHFDTAPKIGHNNPAP